MRAAQPSLDELTQELGALRRRITRLEQSPAPDATTRLAAIVESSDDAIIAKTLDGTILSWNAGAERIYGYSAEEMLGRNIAILAPPEHRDELPDIFRRLAAGLRIAHFQTARVCKDGRRIDVSLTISPLRDARGRIIGAATIARDITAQKRAELAIREGEERLRLALHGADMGWWDWDLVANVLTADAQGKRLVGLAPEEEITFERFLERVLPEDQPAIRQRLAEALVRPGDYRVEFRTPGGDGGVRWILLRGRAFHDAGGKAVRLMGVSMDFTPRKQNEVTLERRVAERTAVAEKRATLLRALTVKLAQAEEAERRRLAQVLHDHLQQLLVAAKLKANLVSRKAGDEKLRRLLQEVDGLLAEAINESRSLAVELSPPVLYERGLAAALEWLAGEVRKKHLLPVTVEADGESEPQNEATRVFLFQAVRELLLNVVKHARAPSARIVLTRQDETRLRLVVADDGAGFDPAAMEATGAKNGFGLFSIRERLELIGGCLTIDSVPGRGTQMVIDAPRL